MTGMAFKRRGEPDDTWKALVGPGLGIFKVAAAPVVAGRQSLFLLLLAHPVQLFRGAIAVVGVALIHQLLDGAMIKVETLRL